MQLQDSLGYLLNISAKLANRNIDKYLSNYNITTVQWHVLKMISTHNVGTVTNLAKSLHSDKATISAIIIKLEKRKLLNREIDPFDKRNINLTLTKKGVEIIEKLDENSDIMNDIMKTAITEEENEILHETLKKIIDKLSN